MSFKDCINNAEAEGKITPQDADRLRAEYDAEKEGLELDYGVHAGDEAAARVFDREKWERLESRRRKLLSAQKGRDLTKAQSAFRNYRGDEDPGEFMILLMEDVNGKLGQSSVEGRYKALRGRVHGRMAELITTFERNVLGMTRNKALLQDIREAAQGGGNEAGRMLYEAFTEGAEFLRRKFNAAGGHIGKLDGWLPQAHDRVAIAKAGYERWREFVLPRLDRERMIDFGTGKPMNDARLETLLREAYDGITTDGAIQRIRDGQGPGYGRSLANRRAEHRFLHFKPGLDGEYQKQFGNGDLFNAMMHHLDAMARDVAQMEILGPNPKATMALLEQNAVDWGRVADGKAPGRAFTRADRQQSKAQVAKDMLALFDGSAHAPVNAPIARSFGALRDALTSAQLASAFLSATSDIHFQHTSRAYVGLPQAKALGQIVNYMLPTSKEETGNAIRAGLIADGATQVASAQARYMGEVNATGITRWMADSAMRWSLLSPWTQGGRWAFGMEFLGHIADLAPQSFDQLKASRRADRQAFARTLDRWGLAGAWDEIRSTAYYEPEKGASFLRPEDIAARTDLPPERADYLASRVLEMVQGETDYAVPTSSLRTRAGLLSGARVGSVGGELLRSGAMYRSFPTTVTYLLGSRAMAEGARALEAGAGRWGARQAALKYGAFMLAGLTLFGALSLQMKELKSGRDPRPMTDGDFWQAAMLQGGGLGIFGDFLFQDTNRFGGSLGTTVAGPVIGFLNDAKSLVGAEPDKRGRELTRFMRQYTPFGNLWYLEAVFHREVLDQLQIWLDEDAEADFRRKMRQREQDMGSGYWWPMGERLPERAPDLENALAEAPE